MSDSSKKTLRLNKPKSTIHQTERIRSGSRAHQVNKLRRQAGDSKPNEEVALTANEYHAEKPRSRDRHASPKRDERRVNPYPKKMVDPARRSESRDVEYASPQKPVHSTTPSRISGKSISIDELFPMFAPCPQGLESALTLELTQLGFERIEQGRSGVHFVANWAGMMRANLYSRIATRILVQVGQAPVYSEDELYELAHSLPWERWFGAEQRLRVDTSAIRSPMKSLQFCNLRVKDGICDRLRQREGARPNIDTVRPDAKVHAFLTETTATLYLDTSGESLFKRGWRYDKGAAPLRENLAAGMLAIAQWDGLSPLMDPFCGSGTILIEAALKSFNVPPGMTRPFSFERLRHSMDDTWQDLLDEAQANILPELPCTIMGSDIDPQMVNAAFANAERAGLRPNEIRFECRDALTVTPISESAGLLLTNPPYGERLEQDEDASTLFWSAWAKQLKQQFGGWHIGMITSDLDLPKKMRLQPQRKTPLFNGALECRLFEFDIVAGSFRM